MTTDFAPTQRWTWWSVIGIGLAVLTTLGCVTKESVRPKVMLDAAMFGRSRTVAPYPTKPEAKPPKVQRPKSEDPFRDLEDGVRNLVVEALTEGGKSPHMDRALDVACRNTSRALNDAGTMDGAASHLRIQLQSEQITDVNYYPFTFGLTMTEDLTPMVDFIRSESSGRGVTHVGVGAVTNGPDAALVTVVLLRRLAALSAFPREVSTDTSHLLWVTPTGPMVRHPMAVVWSPSGEIRDVAAVARGNAAEIPITFAGGNGRYVVQILAEDTYGQQVTNQLDVWAGQPAMRVERAIMLPMEELGDPRSEEKRMFALLNEFRQSNGLKPLSFDPVLQASALRHSMDMRDNRFFGHRSPRFGDLRQRRPDSHGHAPQLLLENIAISAAMSWAHDGLTNSPSHRRNLLDPDVTSVGVGIAVRSQGNLRIVYITQHLGRWPRKVTD